MGEISQDGINAIRIVCERKNASTPQDGLIFEYACQTVGVWTHSRRRYILDRSPEDDREVVGRWSDNCLELTCKGCGKVCWFSSIQPSKDHRHNYLYYSMVFWCECVRQIPSAMKTFSYCAKGAGLTLDEYIKTRPIK